jgi:hypothetical protein
MGLNIFNWHGGTPSWDVMQGIEEAISEMLYSIVMPSRNNKFVIFITVKN